MGKRDMWAKLAEWIRSHKALAAALALVATLCFTFVAYNAYWALVNRDAPDAFTLSEQPLDLDALGLGTSTSTAATVRTDGETTTTLFAATTTTSATDSSTRANESTTTDLGGTSRSGDASTRSPMTRETPDRTGVSDGPGLPQAQVTSPPSSAAPPSALPAAPEPSTAGSSAPSSAPPPAPSSVPVVTQPQSPTAAVDGTYSVINPGVADAGAGYRVLEDVPLGGPETVVGRTSQVSGALTIANGAVTAATVTVDTRSLSTGVGLRDETLKNQYLQTNAFPTSSFVLGAAIPLGSVPADGQAISVSAGGTLNLHGQARGVTASIQARRTGPVIEVVGQIPVKLSAFGIERPDALGRTVRDDATVEFKVYFAR
ncbi:MAG: YceI family protein [Actinobacteria bacterium]|nr:YceI family protein [Actinomycetota bacterium]